VSDDDGRPALLRSVQGLLHHLQQSTVCIAFADGFSSTHLLALGVQRRRRLIQEKNLGVTYKCTSDGNSLLLASTQLSALVTYIGLVALKMNA
jgi:hypothetical protein